MSGYKIIGVDIGATKMHVGLVQDGQVIAEYKFPTAAQVSKEQIILELIAGIERLLDHDVAGIGIGVPGLVDEQHCIVCDVQNIPSWKEVHLKHELEKHFKLPVYLTNDANSFAAGEKMYGKGKAFRNLIGITLGTGLGAGLVIDDKLYAGTLSSAGELGGVPYLDKTIEDYCSGKFFTAEYGVSGGEVYARAQRGDAEALAAFAAYGTHLGNAIKVVLYIVSPQAIFLGGSISKCFPLFEDALYHSLQAFPFKAVTEKLVIQVSDLENAAVLGAAALFQMKAEPDLQPLNTLPCS